MITFLLKLPLQEQKRGEVMSSQPMNGKAPSILTFLLICASYIYVASCTEDASAPELSPQEYFSTLPRSKASLVYFRKDASPSAEIFLEQLENSIDALQDYGISVLKVNCHKEGEGLGYCREDSSLGKAYLFRGRVLLRELPTDALFSVDAIVANVLFALLFNEVKYLRTLEDLQNLEDSLRGRSDLVFAYVQAIGTAVCLNHRSDPSEEHSVCIQQTGPCRRKPHMPQNPSPPSNPKTLQLSNGEPDIPSSQLFFCHCKVHADPSQPCRRTRMEQLLTTLNVHKFLKLMGEPLVVEVSGDPERISTVHTHLGLPLIFILMQEETPVQYLVLKDTDEIVALVEGDTQSEPIQPFQEEDVYEEEEEEEYNEQEIQDDQVVESIIRDRKHELSLENIRTLTEESFGSALSEANHTVVLFYASWEAVSLVVMQAYADVAAHLNGSPEISLARVNCWDWPQVCAQQNVTQFPALKVWTKERRWLAYSGMWETQAMLRFIEV
ncbi:hypothetical protein JD844_020302 [Phrynosoma platyrhinos]|uniref:Thioredoxin domain-containing protein n=1 Tax=Phrynosoma platyrhinos TaxID=52577 RepID=A0ABQ7SSD1_PHRPL|nr:hypothetical protein JD844_020302 [Phrynosoma platyrhinos]